MRGPDREESRRTALAVRVSLVSLVVLTFRALDDAFIQPMEGTAATGHLARGLVPVLGAGLAAWVMASRTNGARAVAGVLTGALGLVAGAEVFYERGPSYVGFQIDDLSSWLSLPAGSALIVCGFVFAFAGARIRRGIGRSVAAVVVTVLTAFPLGLAYVATHYTGAGITTAPDIGAPVDEVVIHSSDGVSLTAWYAASRNGAAVILVPGKSGVTHARLLARHGFGVLLLNRRGEGDSGGDPNLFGWGGGQDLDGAVEFLEARPDVLTGAIGGLGLSVGGEMLLEHAATSPGLDAVVSEGAGSRSIRESLELSGGLRYAELSTAPLLTAGLAVLTDRLPPPNLVSVVHDLADTPTLVIWGERGQPAEIQFGRLYSGVGSAVVGWQVPGAGHTGGIRTDPDAYERRVVEFFESALLDGRSSPPTTTGGPEDAQR